MTKSVTNTKILCKQTKTKKKKRKNRKKRKKIKKKKKNKKKNSMIQTSHPAIFTNKLNTIFNFAFIICPWNSIEPRRRFHKKMQKMYLLC